MNIHTKIPRFPLEINYTPVECVDNSNFLELIINKSLNRKNHIDKLECKIKKKINWHYKKNQTISTVACLSKLI